MSVRVSNAQVVLRVKDHNVEFKPVHLNAIFMLSLLEKMPYAMRLLRTASFRPQTLAGNVTDSQRLACSSRSRTSLSKR